jgi:carboxyl-terminal processing protease
MKQLFQRLKSPIYIYTIFGTLLFLSGLSIGYFRAPEVSRIAGVINSSPTTLATEASAESSIKCLDAKGKEISCDDAANIKSRAVTISSNAVADFSQFWHAWNLINDRYVPVKGKDVNNQEKVWGAISGLTASMQDPYSYFMPPKEKKLFEQDVAGSFGGVGMQIGLKDNTATVIAPMKDSPAERAGVKTGDKIISVDDVLTTEMTMDTVLFKIRGEIGTKVKLKLLHLEAKDPYEVTITREEIKAPTIETEIKDGVFIIRLFGFTQTASDLFRDALKKFADSGTTKLIIDLRGNPGGYLETSVDIASWFLPAGKVVVEEKGRTEHQIYRSAGHYTFSKDYKIAILVDGGSASASEILAGALQQHGVATLIGTKTFGKGSVQELIPITKDTSLKLTVARWIMPNGTTLTDGGINPDIVVEISKEDIAKKNDVQLQKAIEFLKK